MLKQIKSISLLIASGIVLAFVLFSVNQIAAFHANLTTINVTQAWLVTGFISVSLVLLFSIPFVLILRLPKTLVADDNMDEPGEYERKLKARLSKNKRIRRAGIDVYSKEGYQLAIDLLNTEATTIIKQTATSVFLTTAVSQNGKLDALTVFITQSRMIWRIAHIYWQRPSIKDMVRLYANVGATALIASELDDIDLTRQIEPIINALIKSPGRSLPVVGHAAHIITDSILEGSTNAFLTLRVGVVSQRYCGSWEIGNKKEIRKNSFVVASKMLKSLVLESSGKVVKGVMNAMKNAGKSTIKSSVDAISRTGGNVRDKVSNVFKKKTSSEES